MATRAVTISQLTSGVVVDTPAGTQKGFWGSTSGNVRWEMDLGNTVTEGGTNTGADFALTRYDNSGNLIDTPLTIARANGAASFLYIPNAPTPATTDNSTNLATTSFVKNVISTVPVGTVNPNRLDNGDFWVDQHNSGASVAVPAGGAGIVCLDRWGIVNTKAKFTVGQNYATALKAPGFPYFMGVQTTGTGAAPVAADINFISHGIEFDAFNDFGWGTANAQPATLSFWVNSSLTGNFSFALQGVTSPYRTFITTYNVPTANTWTKITIPILADTTVSATNWTGAGNAAGLYLLFDLGSGANNQTSTSLGAWQNSATVYVASGAVKLVATSNAKFAITGVKLEAGSVATAYPTEDLARKLARCQRYFVNFVGASPSTQPMGIIGYAPAGGVVEPVVYFPVQMRAIPTVSFAQISYFGCSNLINDGATLWNVFTQVTATATNVVTCTFQMMVSAEI